MSKRTNSLHRFLNVWFVVTAAAMITGLVYALLEVRRQGYADTALFGTRNFTIAHIVEEARKSANMLGFSLGVVWLLARRLTQHPRRLARTCVVLALLGALAVVAGGFYVQSRMDEDLNNLYSNYVDVDQFLVRTVLSSFWTSPPQIRAGLVLGFAFALVVLLVPASFVERWIFPKPLPVVEERAPRKFPWIAALVVAIAVNGTVALRPTTVASSGAPDVIFISVDTLRADHLSLYGYSRETSPNLEEFARDAIVVDHHIAHAPWTVPTHMSMFTGVLPSVHGVSSPVSAVDPKRTLFPELLKDEGYRNGGFATNILLSSSYGYAAGFDIYVVNPNWNAEQVATPAFQWFHESKAPSFLFLHMFDVHYPYLPPEDYWGKFGPRNATVHEMQKKNFYTFFTWMGSQGPDEHDAVVALYDEEILYTDYVLGRLFEKLRGIGRYDNAWIIVTADHGEEFNERGLWGHGVTLYNEMTHVPLIVKAPRNACGGARFKDRLVPQTALYELIVRASKIGPDDAADLTCGPDGVPKVLSDMAATEPVISEADMLAPLRISATTMDKKLIEPTHVHVKGIVDFDRPYEAFDLSADPAETQNLLTGDDPAALRASINAVAPEHQKAICRVRTSEAGRAKTEHLKLDKATIEKLISLGYLNPTKGDTPSTIADENCAPESEPKNP